VDGLGRTLPNFQLMGGSLSWLSGSWADKMRGQVWRVANFYATTGAQVPLALYKPAANGKSERVLKHPVLDLLYQPNPDWGQFMFFYAVLLQLRSAGNCFVTTVTPDLGSRAGKPSELWILPVLNVQPLVKGKPIADGVTLTVPVDGYRYTPDLSKPGDFVTLERTQVLHLKQYNPNGGVWGMGCITAADKEITGDDSSINTQIALLQNQGPGGAMWFKPVDNRPPELAPGMIQQLRNVISSMFSGSRNAGKFPILTNEVGWTSFGVSSLDLQILDFRRANFADICSYYGVPSLLLNDKEGTTYANLEAARKMLYTQAIMPVLQYLASELTRWLVTQFDPTMWLEPDTSAIQELQANKKEQAEWLALAWWIPTQRKQEIMGETPDPALPRYLVPASLVDPLAEPVTPEGQEAQAEAAAKWLAKQNVTDY
jgi:HK97 family phage portal protein